ncbi:hypothetical protein FS749_005449 [Ceratobasidium sp. UAMH 11750]|nr:hypothetical protein FS749_005449 [Ceratobasidium sp. UAMH 11750]
MAIQVPMVLKYCMSILESWTAGSYKLDTNEELGIPFEELIRYPKADGADNKMAPTSHSPPANLVGEADNLNLTSPTQSEDQGTLSLALQQASFVQYQSPHPSAITYLPPTYHTAGLIPPRHNYYLATLPDSSQGLNINSSMSRHYPHTEDLEEGLSTPYQEGTENIPRGDSFDYKQWRIL